MYSFAILGNFSHFTGKWLPNPHEYFRTKKWKICSALGKRQMLNNRLFHLTPSAFVIICSMWSFVCLVVVNGCKQIVQNQCKFDLPQSHTCGAPRESSKLDLSVPQIKVMWKLCCQTGWPIFSLHGMFSFFLFCSRSSLALSLCLCPHFVCLSDFPPFFVSSPSLFLCKKTPPLIWPGMRRWDDDPARGEHGTNTSGASRWVVGYVNPVLGTCCSGHCQCPAFAQYLPPGRGRPLLRIAPKDNGHTLGSSVSCWGWRENAVCIFCDLWSVLSAPVIPKRTDTLQA